jgi:hypothetical protein
MSCDDLTIMSIKPRPLPRFAAMTDERKRHIASLSERGSYHGYPVPESDPLAAEIRKRWGSRHD